MREAAIQARMEHSVMVVEYGWEAAKWRSGSVMDRKVLIAVGEAWCSAVELSLVVRHCPRWRCRTLDSGSLFIHDGVREAGEARRGLMRRRSFPFTIARYAFESWLARGYILRRETCIVCGIKSKRKQLFAGRIE